MNKSNEKVCVLLSETDPPTKYDMDKYFEIVSKKYDNLVNGKEKYDYVASANIINKFNYMKRMKSGLLRCHY